MVSVSVGNATMKVPVLVRVYPIRLSKHTPLTTGNWSYLNSGEMPLAKEIADSMHDHRMTVAAMTMACFPVPRIGPVGMDLDFRNSIRPSLSIEGSHGIPVLPLQLAGERSCGRIFQQDQVDESRIPAVGPRLARGMRCPSEGARVGILPLLPAILR